MTFKKKIYEKIERTFLNRKEILKKELENLSNSKEADTKSSMGDKYEVGRSMLQMEERKLKGQYLMLEAELNEICSINLDTVSDTVIHGSLVHSGTTLFFISAPIGKMEIDGVTVMAISPVAPLAKALIGRKAGEKFEFLDADWSIDMIE